MVIKLYVVRGLGFGVYRVEGLGFKGLRVCYSTTITAWRPNPRYSSEMDFGEEDPDPKP